MSALVQSKFSTSGSGTARTATFTSNVTAGNMLVLVNSTFTATTSVTAVSGGGVTWVKVASTSVTSGGTASLDVWYGLNSTGGAGTTVISFTQTASTGEHAVIAEFTGYTSFDKSSLLVNQTASGSPGASTASITPAAANELIIGCLVGGSPAAVSPFAEINASLPAQSASAEWEVESGGAAVAATWTLSGSGYTALVMAFGNAAAPSPVRPTPRLTVPVMRTSVF